MQQVIEALERARRKLSRLNDGIIPAGVDLLDWASEIAAIDAALAALRSQPTADEWPNRECALDDQSQCLEAARRIEAIKREREEIAAALEPFAKHSEYPTLAAIYDRLKGATE